MFKKWPVFIKDDSFCQQYEYSLRRDFKLMALQANETTERASANHMAAPKYPFEIWSQCRLNLDLVELAILKLCLKMKFNYMVSVRNNLWILLFQNSRFDIWIQTQFWKFQNFRSRNNFCRFFKNCYGWFLVEFWSISTKRPFLDENGTWCNISRVNMKLWN